MRFFRLSFLAILLIPMPALAQPTPLNSPAAAPPQSVDSSVKTSDSPPGPNLQSVVITTQNWRTYRDYMPDGMAALFSGQYSWKIPADVQMIVGPTIIHPLPRNYLNATEQYSNQVKVVSLPDGGLTLSGYRGGIPFPSPAEPHAGWKVLANLWFRYLPHLTVDTNGVVCTLDSGHSISCKAGMKVYRQLAFNTDPGVPPSIPGAEGKYFTQYESVKEPEQERYTTVLTISYTDLTKPEDVYVFIPALRRYQRFAESARCSADLGTDETPDDRRFGFNMNLTQINAQLLGAKPILSLMGFSMPPGRFPENYDMPLGWPQPSWGDWQLRKAYVVEVTKLKDNPSRCLGKRVVYVDKATSAPVWQDLYDTNMKPWRFVGFFLRTLDVPGIGPIDTSNSMVYGFWDVKYSHATVFAEPGGGQPFYINQQAPKEFFDLEKYTTPGGLDMIMR